MEKKYVDHLLSITQAGSLKKSFAVDEICTLFKHDIGVVLLIRRVVTFIRSWYEMFWRKQTRTSFIYGLRILCSHSVSQLCHCCRTLLRMQRMWRRWRRRISTIRLLSLIWRRSWLMRKTNKPRSSKRLSRVEWNQFTHRDKDVLFCAAEWD